MFKKLKDKIAEEVKSSPQRIQQLTQSVTEKIHTATSDDSFFSIGEDDAPSSNATPELGFSNVSLSNYSTPQSSRVRKNSNSSVASDMSFLPRYESSTNLYHLQSDLDASASELEDNASTSSQLGHLTKEQIYAAFQKSQSRYHKYRGRYTDIANHYRELERENLKMKSVLVETQDKALRRVAELREQCSLEQKAKAHLENALRLEIDEKQYTIDTLKTKVGLLQNKGDDKPETINDLETLTKDLKDAQTEIESLNERLQEHKANAIVFNSKETDLKNRLKELDDVVKQKGNELADVLERERENNLIIAQTKMELHTEIQNRDLEIENLKQDVDALKSDLDQYENRNKSTKLENLQSQNTKLIEKIEELSVKCKGYESELLKLEQAKIENVNKIEEKVTEMRELEERHQKDMTEHRNSTKQHLLSLEAKIRETVEDEFRVKEEQLRNEYEGKLQQLAGNTSNFQEIQVKLLQKEDEVKSLSVKLENVNEVFGALKDKHGELESSYLELITENGENMQKLKVATKERDQLKERLDQTLNEFKLDNNELVKTKQKLKEQKMKFHDEIQSLTSEIIMFKEKNTVIQTYIDEYKEKLNEYETVSVEKSERLHEALLRNDSLNGILIEKDEEIVRLQNVVVKYEVENVELQKRLAENEDRIIQEMLVEHVNCNKEKEERIQQLSDEINEKNLRLEKYEVENEEFRKWLTEKENQLVQINEKMLGLEKCEVEKEEQIEQLQKEFDLKIVTLENYEGENKELRKRLTEQEQIEDELKSRIIEIGQLQKEIQVMTEKMTSLEKYESEYKQERVKLVEEIAQLITSNEDMQAQIITMKANESELFNDKLESEQALIAVKLNFNEYKQMHSSLKNKLIEEKDSLEEDAKQLQLRNNEMTSDYNHVIEENENLLREVAALNLKHEQLLADKQELESENTKLQNNCTQLSTSEDSCVKYENENKALQNQVRELEHQYSELIHEKQLLHDEVQELKIAPININNNENVESLRDEHEKEINHLNEKIVQYKSLDLTNRTSIQFYENELQKLKNKNEKLNRKLDETLVTLNHCTELTSSTETEYLRNVLFNYMLGKESLVLARVIAAVCKFDDNQTEAILQREQQKQTLLGQLGFR